MYDGHSYIVCNKPSGTKPPEKVIGVSPPAVWYLKDDWRPCMCGNWADRSLLAASMCLSVSMPLGLSRTALSLIVRFNSATHGWSEVSVKSYRSYKSERILFKQLTCITNTTCIRTYLCSFVWRKWISWPTSSLSWLSAVINWRLGVVSCLLHPKKTYNTNQYTNLDKHMCTYVHT